MGLAGRKPLLPAPTESLVDESTGEEQGVSEDVTTDLSQRTDRTHHTIPEDGSPIIISTKTKTSKLDKVKGNHLSQTSLLIEYFEAGKGSDPNRRPSVRVKVTPSSRKSKEKGEGHIVLTEAHGTRKRSTSRRISLGSKSAQVATVDSDISVLESQLPLGARASAPLDIEIRQHSDLSDMSASPEARYIPASSDISSMPAESMLGVQQSTLFAPAPRVVEGSTVSSLPREESVLSVGSDLRETTKLKPPMNTRGLNSSNERITQKVIEKLSNKPREPVRANYSRSEKSSSRSTSRDVVTTSYDRPRVTAKQFKEDDSITSPTERSVLSNSAISIGGKSISDHSVRSAATNNSINNPKLLQTVEDAIRRLILPELKELKKDQRSRSQGSRTYEKDYGDLSEEGVVREKSARRSTSGSKSRRRTSKESADRSGSRRRRSSSHREYDYDSISDSDSRREASISSTSGEDPALKKKKHKDHRARNMAATSLVGAGLTAATLEQKESEESLQRRRRSKRSKSRSSRSASIAESEEIFQKHKVPPMPMASDLNSELTQATRSSILSSNTSVGIPVQRELREVMRGSPRQLEIHTPPKHSADLRHSLGMHHGNFSEHNLSAGKLAYEQHDDETLSPETERYASFSAEDILADPERMRRYEQNLHTQHPIRRGLSPIQSVASYATTEANRNSLMQPRSSDTLASMRKRNQQLKEEVSISSFVSAPSPEFKKHRPQGITLENRSEVMSQHRDSVDQSPRGGGGIEDRFSDDEHDRYRDSYATDLTVDSKRLSTLTDDTSDLLYVDKVTAGQHVVPVHGANPEYVSQPMGVESAVASLVEPSVLSQYDSPQQSHKGSFVQEHRSNQSLQRDAIGGRQASPLKAQLTIKSDPSLEHSRHVDLSPPQSPALSYEENSEDYIQRHAKSSPVPQDHADVQASPQSEITTNPSVIQGPIGGLGAGHPEWMADAATPPIQSAGGVSRDFSSGAIDLIPEGLNVSQRHTYDSKPNTYTIGQPIPTPPGVKDEGYATGDNYPSPGPIVKTAPALDDYNLEDDFDGKVDDPFTTKRNQYMSGFSQGMSPLYDSATGRGIDRIQSNDIVALMNHLTVRDAQRNARDTEILVTLVRSAADMRNSFEEMRAFIAEQDEMIMRTADHQHEYTQKVVGGPRPLPANTTNRSARTTPMQDDIPTKRRNVFKRALQGLGSKNSAELQNIESMLMHLLDEVEALRGQQGIPSGGPSQPRSNSIASEEQARPPTDTGYEPEGRAGTASTGGDRSGSFSANSSRQGQYASTRKFPENRVSTVMEGDEEYDEYDDNHQYGQQQHSDQRTPRAISPVQEDDYYRTHRGQSVPLSTPPGISDQPRALSTENTPQMSSDWDSGQKVNRDSRKTFSSVLPKFVSRWSKTTTDSSDPRTPNFRGPTDAQMSRSGVKQRPYSQVSHSGSALDQYGYDYENAHNPVDDQLRSATSLRNDDYYQIRDQENRPPSPLMPSAVSANDNPKYQSHRDSQDLMHPQPRQGPTGRYQFHLENAAKDYHQTSGPEALSPLSAHSQPVSYPQQHQGQNYVSDARAQTLSPISDFEEQGAGHNRTGSAASSLKRRVGASRAPRSTISDDPNEPLVPQRPNVASPAQGFASSAYRATTMSPSTYVDDVRAARAGSPAFEKSPLAAMRAGSGNVVGRKPSGPRPISSGSNKGDPMKRARFEDGSI